MDWPWPITALTSPAIPARPRPPPSPPEKRELIGITAPGSARPSILKCAGACWSNTPASPSAIASIQGPLPRRKKRPHMSNAKRKGGVCLALAGVAAGLLVVSLNLPLWKMRMESPQYKDEEALKVVVYAGKMQGDLKEIELIDRYIGVEIPRQLPQWRWLPVVLFSAGGLGVLAGFLPATIRRRSLLGVALALSVSMLTAASMAQWQMYQIGHHRHRNPIA